MVIPVYSRFSSNQCNTKMAKWRTIELQLYVLKKLSTKGKEKMYELMITLLTFIFIVGAINATLNWLNKRK